MLDSIHVVFWATMLDQPGSSMDMGNHTRITGAFDALHKLDVITNREYDIPQTP